MQVKDIMVPVAGHVDPDMTLRDAAERMKSLNIDPMPITQDGVVVGLLTEGDLVARASTDGLAVGSRKVRDAMSTDIVCCIATMDVADAVDHVQRSGGVAGTGRIPVTDGEQRLVGVVSLDDLRKHDRDEEVGPGAMTGVEAIDTLASYDEDPVDYMSDESFPASDPVPPPTSIGGEDD